MIASPPAGPTRALEFVSFLPRAGAEEFCEKIVSAGAFSADGRFPPSYRPVLGLSDSNQDTNRFNIAEQTPHVKTGRSEDYAFTIWGESGAFSNITVAYCDFTTNTRLCLCAANMLERLQVHYTTNSDAFNVGGQNRRRRIWEMQSRHEHFRTSEFDITNSMTIYHTHFHPFLYHYRHSTLSKTRALRLQNFLHPHPSHLTHAPPPPVILAPSAHCSMHHRRLTGTNSPITSPLSSTSTSSISISILSLHYDLSSANPTSNPSLNLFDPISPLVYPHCLP